MTTKKPISWFLTTNGRRFSFTVMTTAGIGVTLAKYGPHTFFLEKYKEFVHYYRDSKPVELPHHLQERYQKCLNILNTKEIHRKLISPFSVFGYDLFHAGSTYSKFGAAVGIPVNFAYNSLEDLEKDDIQVFDHYRTCQILGDDAVQDLARFPRRLYLFTRDLETPKLYMSGKIVQATDSIPLVNQKKVNWNSDVGQKLANALILPEKVQQFAICREILMTENNKIMIESIYPFTCIFVCYTFAQYLNKRMNLYAGPASLRGILYTLIGLFGAGSYFLLKDMTEVHYESEVDKRLCELGEDFIESGVIFYQKLLERNQALRELMGSEGESKYSKMGNENFGLRQPRLALVHRKQFFEEKLKELKQLQEEIA